LQGAKLGRRREEPANLCLSRHSAPHHFLPPESTAFACCSDSIVFNRSYSSTASTTTTARPCFSTVTGSARAVSISRPKLYFASLADSVCMSAPEVNFGPFWPKWPIHQGLFRGRHAYVQDGARQSPERSSYRTNGGVR